MSYFHNIQLVGCNAKYLNLAMSDIKDVKIEQSDLTESSFIETKIKNLTLDNVNLSNSEIINTSFNNLDLSTCNINNIKTDLSSLRGTKVSVDQALSIVTMLDITIK